MSKTGRLFAIIDGLRRRRRPVTAEVLADEQGVSVRTLYRDIQALIALGAPIEGEAGVGYVLRPGFFLPPLMFTADELEALVLGARWVEGTEGFDSRLYIASGQRDRATAERLALDACTKATRRRCAILALAGNGFIQTYSLGTDGQSATAETSAKRAAQAAQVNCKKRKQACTLQRVYDSRTPGEFVHDFMAPAAK